MVTTSGVAPRLQFDDGSRVVSTINSASSISTKINFSSPDPSPSPTTVTATNDDSGGGDGSRESRRSISHNPRKATTPIHSYYEIDRVACEVVDRILPWEELGEEEEEGGDTTTTTATETGSDETQSGTANTRRRKSLERADGFLCAIAVQFPDEQLDDSAEVAELLEAAISSLYYADEKGNGNGEDGGRARPDPLVFILGDTTYSACCPDEIGAQHLSADLIVHYGRYACLSPTDSLPVVYSFGGEEWLGIDRCVRALLHQIALVDNRNADDDEGIKLLILFEVRYLHAIHTLADALRDQVRGDVVVGRIPDCRNVQNAVPAVRTQSLSSSCCGGGGGGGTACETQRSPAQQDSGCCRITDDTASSTGCHSALLDTSSSDRNPIQPATDAVHHDDDDDARANPSHPASPSPTDKNTCLIGGLLVPLHPSSLSQYTLVFIGGDHHDNNDQHDHNNSPPKSRQLINTLLYCTSPSTSTQTAWSYNPITNHLSTDPTSLPSLQFSRFLNRRYYLIQRAKIANIIGIVVGTLSQSHLRAVVTHLRDIIESTGRACYTFVVGKINVAKLANFAEVDCFVLVSCPETSVLQGEREFHVPIVTPVELEVAFGMREWDGSGSCKTDFEEVLGGVMEEEGDGLCVSGGGEHDGGDSDNDGNSDLDDDQEDDEDDDPIYSMISGTYVSMPKRIVPSKGGTDTTTTDDNNNHLASQPGGGQLTQYRSEAAEFWKQREYKGLEARVGQKEAMPAAMGQTGIASDYGNR